VIEEVRFAIDALVEGFEPSVPREKDPRGFVLWKQSAIWPPLTVNGA